MFAAQQERESLNMTKGDWKKRKVNVLIQNYPLVIL